MNIKNKVKKNKTKNFERISAICPDSSEITLIELLYLNYMHLNKKTNNKK